MVKDTRGEEEKEGEEGKAGQHDRICRGRRRKQEEEKEKEAACEHVDFI